MRSVVRSVALLSEDTKARTVISAPMKFQTRAPPAMRAGSSASPLLQRPQNRGLGITLTRHARVTLKLLRFGPRSLPAASAVYER
jgi:hypothetical protein